MLVAPHHRAGQLGNPRQDLPAKLCSVAQVQVELLSVLWSREELALPGCQTQLVEGRLLWQGPRVKMGAYQDVPLRASPHSSSGRCDYWVRSPNIICPGTATGWCSSSSSSRHPTCTVVMVHAANARCSET